MNNVCKTIIHHPFGKGLYHLNFMLIWWMVYYCLTHITPNYGKKKYRPVVNSTGLLALQLGSRLLVAQSFKFFFVITAHLQKLVAMHQQKYHWKKPWDFLSQKLGISMVSFRSLLSTNSGNYPLVMADIAMENGPVEIVDFPVKNGGSFHSYVSLPESIHEEWTTHTV